MKAIGMYIFSGSQTIGHLEAGWEVDKVLEMTENMDETNAFHFVRNYPNIPIVKPSIWDNEEYLSGLKGTYDLLFANPPCSGLSAINRNASADNDVNKHIYEVANTINKIEPKTFLIENAPTLITKGAPILKDIQKILSNKYRVTVITDLAGNHNVPMFRKRTLVIGWRRDIFSKMPLVSQRVNNTFTVGDAFSNLDEADNMTTIDLADKYDFSRFYKYVEPGDTVVKTLCKRFEELGTQLTDEEKKLVLRAKEKYDAGGSVWDKSPLRLELNGRAPSITSVNRYIHPTENRDIYIRECARLMGYPDSYKFYNGSKVSVIQCVAQGVPVNFIKYISNEIMCQLKHSVYYDDCDVIYINQVNGIQDIVQFTTDEFQKFVKVNKNDRQIEEVNLWQ